MQGSVAPLIRPTVLDRGRLLRSTALQAVALSLVVAPAARGQVAPNARPFGGQVVGGTATIATTPNATDIDQSSQRAAINWQGFDVGSQQSVNFHQPGATAVILNRVTGPDPSAIAGRITANGQVVITNPNGVVFSRGAQVNAQSIVVSAAGITNRNFMAGRMVFDQAGNPTARIENRGTLTVGQAGLAALVAPSVANSGVITARLGRVVLAGAVTHTLDLYGDGLISLDVGSEVRETPRGPDGKPVTALVTNTGEIDADGGTVQITAAAADGVIQNLVDAGGRIRADTVGARPGAIEIAGTGGSVILEGEVEADGATSAGAGTIAIGTDLARRQGDGSFPAGTSPRTVIGRSARISASGHGRAPGGHVTILSTDQTEIDGTILATGGTLGGNGGTIELSGEHGFGLTGRIDASAPRGDLGTIVLDPTDLTIVASGGTNVIAPGTGDPNIAYNMGTGSAQVLASAIEALRGNVHLQALDDLTVAATFSLGAQNLTLEAGRDLTINSGVAVTTAGEITLSAASANVPGFNAAGTLGLLGTVATSGDVFLNAGTGGILVGGLIDATGSLTTDTPGPFLEQGAGSIIAGDLEGTAGSVSLLSPGNRLASIAGANGSDDGDGGGSFTVTGTTGNFALQDAVDLSIGNASLGGALSVQPGNDITLIADRLTLNRGFEQEGTNPALVASGGTITIAPYTQGAPIVLTDGTDAPTGLSLDTNDLALLEGDVLALGTLDAAGHATAGDITVSGTVDLGSAGFNRLALASSGVVGGTTADELSVTTLSGVAGTLSLLGQDYIATLDTLSTSAGPLALHSSNTLTVTGLLSAAGGAADLTLSSSAESTGASVVLQGASVVADGFHVDTSTGFGTPGGGLSQSGGSIDATSLSGNVAFADLEGANRIGTLVDFASTASGLSLDDDILLHLDGTVSVAGAAAFNAPGIDQVGGALTTPTLEGSSIGDVNINQPANQIASIGTFAMNGTGLFSLATAAPTLAFGAGTFSSLATLTIFSADSVALEGETEGPVIEGGAGVLEFRPLTAKRPVELVSTIGTADAESLALDAAFLSGVRTGTLLVGGVLAGPITVGHPGDAISLRAVTPTLVLVDDLGTVTEGAGASLDVATLDAATGPLTLAGANSIDTLGSVVTNGLDLVDTGSLALAGPITATGSTGIFSVTASSITAGGTIVVPDLTLDATTGGIGLTGGTILTTDRSGAIDLEFVAGSGPIFQTSGVISAGTLAVTADSVSLASTTNRISALAAGAASGEFSINDTGNLSVTGALGANDVSLFTFGTLTVGADIDAGSITLVANSGDLSLVGGTIATSATQAGQVLTLDGNVVTQGSDTAIVTTGLGGRAGTLLLDSASNIISAVPFYNDSGTFSLTDAAPSLTVGTLIASNVRLDETVGSVTFAGPVTASAGTLLAAASLTESQTGTLDIGTLSATGSAVTLTGTNAIADLALIATPGSFALVDAIGSATGLTVSGPVSAGSLSITTPNAPLFLNGAIAAASATLDIAGSILGETGSSLSLGSLTGSASGLALVAGSNTIGALGPFTSTAGFALADSAALTVAGPVRVGSADLLSIFDDALSFGTAGALIAPSGTVQLAEFTPTRGITLDGTAGFSAVTADVLAIGSTLGGPILIESTLDFGDVAALDLLSAGAVTETGGGAIIVQTLDGNAGTFDLRGQNEIAFLGSLVAGTSLILDDGNDVQPNDLGIVGTLDADLLSIMDAGSISISGSIRASAVTLTADGVDIESLGANALVDGTLTQSGGAISGATVTLSALDEFQQTGGVIVASGSGAAVMIDETGQLLLNGTIQSPSLDLVAASRTFSAPDAAPEITPGSVLQQTGALLVGTLDGSVATTASLVSTSNTIAAIGSFTSTDGLILHDAAPTLTVAGVLLDQTAIELDTRAITLAGSLIAPSVTLNASGAIAETIGTLLAETLSGFAADASLLGASNSLDILGSFASAGSFAFADASPLTVGNVVSVGSTDRLSISDDALAFGTAGALVAPGGTVQLAEFTAGHGITLDSAAGFSSVTADVLAIGSTLGGPIAIEGDLDVGSVTVLDLLSAGSVTESGAGAITGQTLDGVAAGFDLRGANQIAALGSIVSAGSFVFSDGTGGLPVDLAVTGPIVSNAISILDAGSVSISGSLFATAISIDATGADNDEGAVDGSITQSGGVISGNTITLSALDAFTQAGGTIAASGAGADTVLIETGTLLLAGTIQSPQVDLVAASRTFDLGDGPSSVVAGAVVQQAGALLVGTLDGSVTASVDLLSNSNSIAAIGSFASGNGFVLHDGAPTLVIAGTLLDPTSIELDTGAITLAGSLIAPVVSLNASGAIDETTGTLLTETLTGFAADAALLGASNSLDILGSFASTGSFALADAFPLTVRGVVSVGSGDRLSIADDDFGFVSGSALVAPVGTVQLAEFTPGRGITLGSATGFASVTADTLAIGSTGAGAITIAGSFDLAAVPVLELLSAGTIAETSFGALSVPTLAATGADIDLVGANRIGTLAAISSSGTFDLIDQTSLTTSGSIAAANVSILSAGSLVVGADMTASTIVLDATGGDLLLNAGTIAATSSLAAASLTLDAGGRVSQAGANAIVAAGLHGEAADLFLTSPNNDIAAIVSYRTPNGDIALVDAAPMLSIGTLATTALQVTETGGAISIDGSLTATTVTFDALGSLSQSPTGTLIASNLDAIASGISLSLTASPFLVLDDVTATSGNVVLTNAATGGLDLLMVDGTIAAPSGSVTLSQGGTIFVDGKIAAPLVQLQAGGDIAEAGGSIVVTDLAATAGGSIDLSAANAIDALATSSAVGSFKLADTIGLAVTGQLSAPAITLQSRGDLTEPDGSITATTLSASGATLSLTSPGNRIGTLGALSASGNIVIEDAASVTVSGVAAAGSMDVVSLSDDALTFGTGGALIAPSGTVTLSALTPGSGLTLGRSGGIASNPPVVAKSLVIGSATGGALAITGSFDLSNVPVLQLLSGADVTETSQGALSVATLSGQARSFDLGGANRIGTLGALSAISGPILVTDTGTLQLAGLLLATSSLVLDIGGTLTERAGAGISASLLSGSAAAATLDSPLNAIGTLGPFDAAGAVTLTDASSLTLAGTIDVGSILIVDDRPTIDAGATIDASGNTVAFAPLDPASGLVFTDNASAPIDAARLVLGGSAGALTLAGDIALAGPGIVELRSGSSITEASGALIAAATLSGDAAGSVSLDGANQVATLGSFASGSSFAFADTTPVTLGGLVSAAAGGTVSIADDTTGFSAGGTLSAPGGVVDFAAYGSLDPIALTGGTLATGGSIIAGTLAIGSTIGGPISISGSVSLDAATSLDLLSAGAITETADGALVATRLDASGATIVLTGPNQIGALGDVSATGNLSFNDATAFAIAGSVTVAGALSLTTTGAITELSGGSLSATLLTGSAASLQATNVANRIADLGPLTTTTLLNLTDGQDLTVVGAIDPTAVTLNVRGNVTIQNAITGDTVSLVATGAIVESGAGRISTGVLNASASTIALDAPDNAIGTLGGATATGSIALADGMSLQIAGNVSASALDLTSAGDIEQSAGALTATTLTGSAAGAAGFGTEASASIGTLDGFSAGSTLTLTDAAPLTISGRIAAPDLAITGTGEILLAGGTIATRGLPPAQQLGATSAPPGSYLDVSADTDGNAVFLQTGTTRIVPYDTSPSTLRIQVPDGTISFSDLQAPSTTIILATGQGNATGMIDAGALLVLDQGGNADLTGSVGALSGTEAAAISRIFPGVNVDYRLNGCEIGNACLPAETVETSDFIPDILFLDPIAQNLLSPQIIQRSLVDATLIDRKRRRTTRAPLLTFQVLDMKLGQDDDATVQLPNISDRDY